MSKEVGQLSIRVRPDTSKFREELEAQLKAATAGIDEDAEVGADFDANALTEKVKAAAKAASGETVKVEAEVDLDRFKNRYLGKMKSLMSQFESNMQLSSVGEGTRSLFKDLEQAFNKQVRALDLTADRQELAGLRREVAAFYSDIERRGRDNGLFNSQVDGGVKQTLKRASDKWDVELKIRTDEATAQYQAWKAKAANEAITVQTRIKPDPDLSAFARVKFGIEAMFSNIRVRIAEKRLTAADIFPDIDDVAKKAVKGFGDVGTSAATSIPKLLSFSNVVLVLGVAVLALIPPLIALASGLITLAPGFLALIAPIGAVMLGLDGIKKAAEVAKPAFEELKASISKVFEESMTPGFEAIRDRLLPGLTVPLEGVASSISNAFNGVIDTLSSPEGLNNLQGIIDNVAAGINNAIPGLQNFTDGLLTLVRGISAEFPNLGDWITEMGGKFADWAKEFTTVDATTGVSQLDTLLTNVKDSLREIGGLFSDTFANGLKDITDPSFGAGMREFFSDIRTFVAVTLPQLSQGFENVMGVITTLTAPFEKLGNLIDKINKIPGIGLAKNALKGLNPAFGAYDQISDAIQQDPGAGGADVGKALIDQNAVTQQAIAVGKAARQEFDKTIASMPVDDQKSLIGAALGGDAVGQAQWGAKLATAAAAAKDGVAAQFDGVKTAVQAKWLEINQAVTTGITGMQTTISTFFTQLPLGFQGAFTGIQQSITGMFALITLSISTQSANITNSFQTAFSSIGPAIGNALSSVPTAITGALSGIRGSIDTTMNEAAQAAADGGLRTAAAAQASFGTVPAAVTIGMSPAIVSVSTICQQMVSTALAFAGAMEQSGVAIGASFARGIASQASLVASSANALMAAARVFFPNSPAKEGPFSGSGWVDKSGEAIGEGFALGIDNSAGGVVGVARQMMQAVKDVFGDASGLTLNFNLGATAMGSMAADAESFKGSMEGAAASLKTVNVPSGVGGGTSGNNFAGKVDSQTKGELDVLKYQQEYLDLQRQSLQLQTNGASEAQKAELKRQMDMLSLQKDRIGLQAKELEYWSKYQDTGRDLNEEYAKAGDKLQTMGTDFAKATGQQFMSDLGMSGDGAIPNLIDQGSQYIFQVLDVQSALTGQQVLQNKKAQQYTGGM
jgi:hypothetical protein